MCYILHDMVKKYKAAARAMGVFALTFVLALSFDSCARKRSENAAPAAAAPAGPVNPAAAPAAQPQASSALGASAAQPAAPQSGSAPGALPPGPRPAAVLSASLRAYGLGADRPITPSDFDIGPMQDLRNARGPAKEVLDVARAFVAGLSTGKLDTAILDPASRPALALLLAPPEASTSSGASGPEGASGYRLGSIKVVGDSASLAIGIPEGNGSARERGRLSLGLSGGRWYVEAFELDPRSAPASAARQSTQE